MASHYYLPKLLPKVREVLCTKGYIVLYDVVLPDNISTMELTQPVYEWHIDKGHPILGIYQSKYCTRQCGTDFGLVDTLDDLSNPTLIKTVSWDKVPYISKLVMFTNGIPLDTDKFLVHRTSSKYNFDVNNKGSLLALLDSDQCNRILSNYLNSIHEV